MEKILSAARVTAAGLNVTRGLFDLAPRGRREHATFRPDIKEALCATQTS